MLGIIVINNWAEWNYKFFGLKIGVVSGEKGRFDVSARSISLTLTITQKYTSSLSGASRDSLLMGQLSKKMSDHVFLTKNFGRERRLNAILNYV